MQTKDQQQNIGTGIASSGFEPIPNRIQNPPPLVVTPENEQVKAEVVSSLQDLGQKLATIHRTSAEAYMAQQMYSDAVIHLEAALSMLPGNLEVLNQLGFARYVAGNDVGAIECFELLLQAQPNNGDALFNLGMVLFGQEQYAKADECFRRSLEIDANHAETWNNRGVCQFKLNNKQAAASCFNKAISIDPQNEDASYNLSTCV